MLLCVMVDLNRDVISLIRSVPLKRSLHGYWPLTLKFKELLSKETGRGEGEIAKYIGHHR